MRRIRPGRLLRALLLTGTALVAGGAGDANAGSWRSDAEMCATQTVDLAASRITACTNVLKSGRLRGEPLGIAFALRGLAYRDRGDIPHAIGDLDQAIKLAPDFARPIRTAATPGTDAAISAKRSPITTVRSGSIRTRLRPM